MICVVEIVIDTTTDRSDATMLTDAEYYSLHKCSVLITKYCLPPGAYCKVSGHN